MSIWNTKKKAIVIAGTSVSCLVVLVVLLSGIVTVSGIIYYAATWRFYHLPPSACDVEYYESEVLNNGEFCYCISFTLDDEAEMAKLRNKGFAYFFPSAPLSEFGAPTWVSGPLDKNLIITIKAIHSVCGAIPQKRPATGVSYTCFTKVYGPSRGGYKILIIDERRKIVYFYKSVL